MSNEVTVLELNPVISSEAPVRQMPPRARQVLSIGGSASSAFTLGTTLVAIYTTTACNIEFGTAPTGVTNKIPLPAGVWHDFGVLPGHKVIVVA